MPISQSRRRGYKRSSNGELMNAPFTRGKDRRRARAAGPEQYNIMRDSAYFTALWTSEHEVTSSARSPLLHTCIGRCGSFHHSPGLHTEVTMPTSLKCCVHKTHVRLQRYQHQIEHLTNRNKSRKIDVESRSQNVTEMRECSQSMQTCQQFPQGISYCDTGRS